jgi:hypothetical protein
MNFKYKYLKYKNKYLKLHGRGLTATCKIPKTVPKEIIDNIETMTNNMPSLETQKDNLFSIKLIFPIINRNTDETSYIQNDLYFNINIKYNQIIKHVIDISNKSYQTIHHNIIPDDTIVYFRFMDMNNIPHTHILNIYYDFTKEEITIERLPSLLNDDIICLDNNDLIRDGEETFYNIFTNKQTYNTLSEEEKLLFTDIFKRSNYRALVYFYS